MAKFMYSFAMKAYFFYSKTMKTVLHFGKTDEKLAPINSRIKDFQINGPINFVFYLYKAGTISGECPGS